MIDAQIALSPLGVITSDVFGYVDDILQKSPFGVATTKFLLSMFIVYPFAAIFRNIKSKDGMYKCIHSLRFLV